MIILFLYIPLRAQDIPDDFRANVDSLLTTRPVTYRGIDGLLRPNRRDTVLMGYFIEQAIAANYPDGLTYAYNQLGTKFRNISQYDRAIELHQKALEYAVEANNIEFRIFSLNMLGVVYRRKEAIKTALDYCQEALELAETIESPSLGIKRSINVSLNSIGNMYQTLKQYDRAISQFERSLQLETEIGNKRGMAVNHQNIGDCLQAQGKLEAALENYRIALGYDEEIGSESGKTICNNGIAEIYIQQGKHKEALELLRPTLATAEKIGDQFITTSLYLNLGWALTRNGSYQEAARSLRNGLQLSEGYNLLGLTARGYALLSELERLRGNPTEALKFFKLAKDYEARVYNDVNMNYLNDVIIRYDTEKKNNQIQTLERENEIVKLRLRRNQTTLVVSGLLLALFTLILYILYRQYQLNNEKKMLSLEQNLLRSQMNPHFLFNSLNSIKLYIINNEQKHAVHYLNKFSKLVRKILDASSVREIPLAEELETADLYMNIENIRFSNEIDFKIEMEPEIDPHLVKVPSLILQPFLENALWHGLSPKKGEKSILIKVRRKKKGFIEISITDNGVGREVAEKLKKSRVLKRKSVGIDITKERLANFSRDYQHTFKLEIVDLFDDHKKPAGTKVIMHLPTI